jgi:hypothetical protein
VEPRSVPAGKSRSFRQPPVLRWLAWLGVVLCAPSCPLSLALPFWFPQTVNWPVALFSFAMFAAGLFVSVSVVRRSTDTVVVDDAGIRCESAWRAPVSIPWNEIGDVEQQNVMQRLVVTDRTGERRIMAEFHLPEFGVLRRTVLERFARSASAVDRASNA